MAGLAKAQSLAAPSSLSAATISKYQVNLQWNDPNPASSGNQETGYVIERAKGSPTVWSEASVTPADTTAWPNMSLAAGTTYFFRVRAFVVSGGATTYSAYSPVASAATQSTNFPDPPVGLMASAASDTQLKLTWQNKATNATGYHVQRLVSANTWSTIGDAASSANYYVVTGLSPQTTYTFRVTSFNASGDSPPSAQASGTTKGAAVDQTPPSDGTLTATAVATSQVNVSWSGFSDLGSGINAASYKLMFAIGALPPANCTGGTLLSNGAALSFSHTGLAASTTYFYRVCVSDMAGNVSAGATGSATTTAGGTGNGTNGAGIKINGDAPYTNNVNVTVNLGMADSAGVVAYWVSSNSNAPTAGSTGWVAVAQTTIFSANVSFSLTAVDGTRTLYAWFKNAAGAVSAGYSDSILLDRVAPFNGTMTATGTLGKITLNWSGFADGSGSGLASPNAYTVVTAQGSAPASCSVGTPLYTGPLTSFDHANVPSGTNFYRVCATDKAGNTSSGATASASALSNVAPVAQAGPAQIGSAGTTVYFDASGSTDSDGSIVSYSYTFGDGLSLTSGNAAVVGHTYSNAGTYTMTLTVTDNQGLASSDTALVTIRAATASQGNFSSVKQMGGSGIDVGYGVAVDGAGNVVTVGTFQNTINFGGGNLTSAGASDVYIAKFSAAGTHICSLAIGGPGDERANSVAVDASGNIIITGSYQGTVNFGGGIVRTANGGGDAFVAKYSSNCATSALWVRTFGSSTDDAGYGVVVDPSGDVVVTGYFSGYADFGGGNVLSNGPFADVFIVKYAGASGAYLWSHILSGISVDIGRGVAVDAAGNFVVGGSFSQTVAEDLKPTLLTSSGAADGFLMKYSSAGVLQWARSFGGPGEDIVYGIAIDKGGNIAVAGSFENSISFNGVSLNSAGLSDGFLARFSPMGNYLWAARIGAAEVDIGYAIAADDVGNVVITGAVQTGGQQDIIVSKYSAVGVQLWTRNYGGSANDVGYDVALDSVGNVYVTGYFQGSINFGSGVMPSAGFSDVFLLKLTP